MKRKKEVDFLTKQIGISIPLREILDTYSKKEVRKNGQDAQNLINAIKNKKIKISDKKLENLLRYHVRVLDLKEQKSASEADLALILIGNLCNLKPPSEKITRLLAKSLRKLEKLNPLFLPLIIGKGNPNFSVLIYANSIKKNFGDKLTSLDELKGNTVHFGNNKVMILLNTSALGFYSEDVFLHELLHVVDDMIIPDAPKQKKFFHGLINKHYGNILHKTAIRYRDHQKKAHKDFANYLKKIYLPEDHKEQVKALKKGIELIYYKKYALWAADESMAEEILTAKRFLGKEINDSAEVFAYGLQFYMNPKMRKILRKRDPVLYGILKDVIIPSLKNLKIKLAGQGA